MAFSNRTMQHMTNRAGTSARDAYDQLRHTAEDYLGHGRESATHMAHSVQDSLREHPVRWLLVGIGVGCLISAALLDR